MSIEAKQIRFATTETVNLTDPIQQRDKARVNRGNQPTGPTNEAEEEKSASTLKLMQDNGFGSGIAERVRRLGF
jgi:hypothetical protein